MQNSTTSRRKPNITLSETDHERLTRLAATIADRAPDAADELMSELDRARVVPSGSSLADRVQMGSTVKYRTDAGEERTVALVYPADADIAVGKVSILTPIGTALLGLAAGQSIAWTARDGRSHELTVLAVQQPVLATA